MHRIKYIRESSGFSNIPGTPLAYWVSDKFIDLFNGTCVKDVAHAYIGMRTGDNDRFLRQWFEVSLPKIGFHFANAEDAEKSKAKWIPYNKGGEYRKWYGNHDYVVNWENDGAEIKENTRKKYPQLGDNLGWKISNEKYYFQEGLSWTVITSKVCFRRYYCGCIFSNSGQSVIAENTNKLDYLLAVLNSKISALVLNMISPTMGFESGYVNKVPVIIGREESVIPLSQENTRISKEEWDDFEISWDFKRNVLVRGETMGKLISEKYDSWERVCKERFFQLKANEEELNSIFINIYGLQDELTPEVEDKDITVRLADKEREIRSLISYLIGIVMGRYSLDVEGLAYAGGNWDDTKYVTYKPDDDGIVPIYNEIGMEDGLTTMLINLIKQIYGEDTYRQNIDYIADALGKNNNESSEESLNRYLNDGFYADHLKIYQKRPIYWLFTSGKKAGFKCLIYMHRYNEDTLARINAKYFLPESTRKKNELDELNGRIAHAEGRDKLRLEKKRQNLAAAYNEAIEYGQILDHMANQYISIDLDDGVKVNYAKFQGVEIVTDGGSKVKKDLLAPLK